MQRVSQNDSAATVSFPIKLLEERSFYERFSDHAGSEAEQIFWRMTIPVGYQLKVELVDQGRPPWLNRG
jgi:hypothetical protein